MSAVAADFLPWEDASRFIRNLEDAGDYHLCLAAALGCFWGLRIGEILELRWKEILGTDAVAVKVEKSGQLKTRIIEIVPDVKNLIARLYGKSNVNRVTDRILLNPNTGTPLTTQGINAKLKRKARKMELNIENFSTHTFRKTFGRHYWERNDCSDRALTVLCEIFQHESIRDTRRYLGINRQEIKSAYRLFRL